MDCRESHCQRDRCYIVEVSFLDQPSHLLSSFTNSIANALWVIRSAGERTTAACEYLIRQFAPSEQVVVMHERPFSAALHRGFELGAASGLKWMVCIDADVLVHAPGIIELLTVAESVDENTFYVQGLTIDKLIPIKRPPGNGIYRNALADKARQFIPEDGTSLRPETTTMEGMIAAGYRMYRTNIVVGLHDFEQSYADIYRKSFLHAKKHANVLPRVKAYWKQHEPEDQDFTVARLGARVGQTYGDTVYLDREFQQEEWQLLRQLKNIEEKPPLDAQAYSPEDVRKQLEAFATDPALQQQKFPQYQESYLIGVPVPWFRRMSRTGTAVVGCVANHGRKRRQEAGSPDLA